MYYNQFQEENNLPKALGISTLVMAALGVIGFFIVFGQNLPEYGMGGIIVNYGTSPEGMGEDYMSVDEPSMDENANNVRPDKIDPNSTPIPTPSQQVADKAVATQDVEEAPVVAKTEKPVKANAEQSTAEKKDATPAVNPNALYKGKKNNAQGTGDGTGSTPGNQGSKLGDPLASNYGDGGSGFGNAMLSLENRRFTVPPKIDDNGQQTGIVKIEFTVDKSGNITRARQAKGTTIADYRLIEKCIRAVQQARLNELPNAPQTQTGLITFRFRVR
ncbi:MULTISPECIES: energy transducer TonB [Sphingobacterium]|jgi:outer membrane biosynthesis protein TonB|uniref:energy transducer TonB n=1 Tax=Sphingobacterium TaxID=28453 RepID=UPI000C0BE0E2|nr:MULTISPECIES: energy transducer TonB [Sphingobacterium]MCT1532938.1 energy transducer TonB [Sphingobacterium daejeonense]